jgi:tRNA (guanine37-N1)-methyltransferase
MKFDIISIFPKFFDTPLSHGIIRIAKEKGIIKISITNPRDFTNDGVVDDYQFGGGAGMVMKPEPLTKAINSVKTKNSCLIHLNPKGKRLNQKTVNELANKTHIIIICGRYKGIDERINFIFKPLEISLGDYILSGGEVGALVLVESITRLLPNVLGNKDSADTDSFQKNIFESPIYTRPNIYKRFRVPEILRSGNHQLVALWRRKKSLKTTLEKRPDLISSQVFSKKDFEILLEVLDEKNS